MATRRSTRLKQEEKPAKAAPDGKDKAAPKKVRRLLEISAGAHTNSSWQHADTWRLTLLWCYSAPPAQPHLVNQPPKRKRQTFSHSTRNQSQSHERRKQTQRMATMANRHRAPRQSGRCLPQHHPHHMQQPGPNLPPRLRPHKTVTALPPKLAGGQQRMQAQ